MNASTKDGRISSPCIVISVNRHRELLSVWTMKSETAPGCFFLENYISQLVTLENIIHWKINISIWLRGENSTPAGLNPVENIHIPFFAISEWPNHQQISKLAFIHLPGPLCRIRCLVFEACCRSFEENKWILISKNIIKCLFLFDWLLETLIQIQTAVLIIIKNHCNMPWGFDNNIVYDFCSTIIFSSKLEWLIKMNDIFLQQQPIFGTISSRVNGFCPSGIEIISFSTNAQAVLGS